MPNPINYGGLLIEERERDLAAERERYRAWLEGRLQELRDTKPKTPHIWFEMSNVEYELLAMGCSKMVCHLCEVRRA